MSNNKQSSVEKDFIPYEQALALKELGFDEPCCKYIYLGDTGNNLDLNLETEPSESINFNSDSLCVSRPTFSQAFRWFREKYGICGYVSPLEDGSAFYHMIYTNINVPYSNRICTLPEKWQKHEEAELACLLKLIEVVKTKL